MKTSEIYKALKSIEEKTSELEKKLQTTINVQDIAKINKTIKNNGPILERFNEYKQILQNIDDSKMMLENETDKDLITLAKEEIIFNEAKIKPIEEEIKFLLIPKDPNDEKNVIMEIRPAAGGDEASIFVGDLFRMYSRFVEKNGWKLEINEAQTNAHGYSYLSFMIKGKNAFSKLKFENGVHRVQRIPATESKGRVHTSTVTVVAMPEIEMEEVKFNMSDVKVDTFRASGAGGQHVNTTDSAVRLTHIPSGIVVASQEGRSQIENKDKALKVMVAKLWELEEQKSKEKLENYRSVVGTGDRSEKIRTYNYPQNRLTDHRIGLTLNKLATIINGDLEEVVSSLLAHEKDSLMTQQYA